MTGARMPPGADSVCMVERTRSEVGGSMVIVEEAVAPGTNVRRAGEDIESNTEVFVPGTLLTAPHVGVLAGLGVRLSLFTRLPGSAWFPPAMSWLRHREHLRPGR